MNPRVLRKNRKPRRRGVGRQQHRRLSVESLERRDLLAVTFEFNYIDSAPIGFNDPIRGSEFRNALDSAASRIGDQLLHDATIQINVFTRSFEGTALALAASQSRPAIAEGGFAYRVIPSKIVGEGDLNGSAADGRLEVFFFDEDDDFQYVTDPADGFVGAQLDFQAIMMHEIVHTIGFTSATNFDGRDDFGGGVGTPGTWTAFDQFLSDVDGNRLIDGDANSSTAFQMDVSSNGWPTVSVGGSALNGGGLYFDGPIASSVYGGRVPLYSPAVYSLSSTGSHLDSEGFPGPSVFSPLNDLMSHATVVGDIPQGLTLLQKAILADIGIMFVIDDGQDFGDAPSEFPVQLSEDGARHFPSALSLGANADFEQDGQPSDAATGDGSDDDGVISIASIISTQDASASSSVVVDASADAFLNGWIDWNQDGQWTDDEKVFDGLAVNAGENILAFSVPANVAGTTAARFRLSSQVELNPTGPAGDGEVEDYLFIAIDGATRPNLVADLVSESSTLSLSGPELQLVQDGATALEVPIETIDSIQIHGDATDNTLTVEAEPLPIPTGSLGIFGGDGEDTLRFLAAGKFVDLANTQLEITDFERLDLSDPTSASVRIDRSVLDQILVRNESLVFSIGAVDRLDVTDFIDWRMTGTVHDGDFDLTATNQVEGQVIHAESLRPWQNFLQAGDINNDGSVSASDALRIINELARRSFSNPTTQILFDPSTMAAWPNTYFDHNGDNLVSALDALRVINDIARQNVASGEWVTQFAFDHSFEEDAVEWNEGRGLDSTLF